MRMPWFVLAAGALFGCSASPALRAQDQQQRAPDFTLLDTEGKPRSLKAELARGPVILAFFPKAFTFG
jgi:hypothetical protein